MSSDVQHIDDEAAEAREMGKALKWGIGLGTPITIVVFFVILMLAGVGLQRSIVASIWTGIVGGAFYGGIAAILHVMNKHPH